MVGSEVAEGKLLALSGTLGRTGLSAANVFTGIAVGAAAAFVAVGVESILMAGNFERSVLKLYTTAGEAKGAYKQVGQAVLDMSVQVGTGAQKLVDAMYWVESGSFHGAKGLEVLKIAAQGAKTENADLTGVVKALTGAMVGFSGEHLTAAQTMNILIASTAQGKLSLADLSGSLGNVMAAAGTFKIHMIDVTAAIAVMTTQNDNAASAATHLRQVILALESPAKAGAKAIREIGLTTQQVSDAMKKSLPDAIQMIVDAMKKKFPEGSAAYNDAMKAIAGGNKQLMGLLELSGVHLKEYRDKIADVTKAMKDGGNAVLGWSDVQQTFNYKMDAAKAAVERLMIVLGTALLPAATRIVGVIGQAINALATWEASTHTLANTFLFLGESIKGVVDGIGAVIGFFKSGSLASQLLVVALAGVVAGFLAWKAVMVVSAISAFLAALPELISLLVLLAAATWATVAAEIALALPFILIAAAVAAVVGVFLILYDRFKVVRDAVTSVIGALTALWNFLVATFTPIFKQIGDVIRGQLLPAFAEVSSAIHNALIPAGKALADAWKALKPILAELGPLFALLLPVLKTLGAIILGVVVVSLLVLLAVLVAVVKGIAGALPGIVQAFTGIVQIISGIVQIISGYVRFIVDLMTGNFGKLKGDLAVIWSGIVSIFSGAWNLIAGVFNAAYGLISGLVSGFVNTIIGFFKALWHAVVGGSIIPDMVNGIISWFGTLVSRGIALIASLVSGVISQVSNLRAQAIAAVANLVASWLSQLANWTSQSIAQATRTGQGMLSAISSFASSMFSSGLNMINQFANGISAGIGAAIAAAQGVANAIAGILHHSTPEYGPLAGDDKWGIHFMESLVGGMKSGIPSVGATASLIAQTIAANAKPIVPGNAFGQTALRPSSMPVGTLALGSSGAGQAPITVVVHVAPAAFNVDGRVLTQALGPHIASEVLATTGIRRAL